MCKKKQPIYLTRFTATDDSNLIKRFSLNDDGQIEKTSSAQFSKGVAKQVILKRGVQDLPELVQDLESIECIATGVFDDLRCRVVPKGSAAGDKCVIPVRNRNIESMPQPSAGLILFDHDPSSRMPECIKCNSPNELMKLMAKAVPAIKACSWAGRGSSSTGIFNKNTDRSYSGSGGIHIFVEVEIEDLDLLKKNLETSLWLAGYGYVEFAANGKRLLRTIIDRAVLSPERLIFVAEPELGPGVGRKSPEWELHEGGRLTLNDFDLTESDHARAKALQDEALNSSEVLERAKAVYEQYRICQAERLSNHQPISKEEALAKFPNYASASIERAVAELPSDHLVEIQGNWLTISELFERAADFDGASMPDPIEGRDYGRTTATFYANAPNGSPVIHSHAHGMSTSYVLEKTKYKASAVVTNQRIDLNKQLPLTDKVQKANELSEPLEVNVFPHVNQATGRPKATIENYRCLLDGYKIVVRYNVISKEIEINIPGMEGSPDNHLPASLTRIESLATLNDLSNTQCSKIIGFIANENQYNPIADWIDSQPWDGRDRLPEILSTLEVQEDFPSELRDALVYRWLLSAAAAVLKPSGFHCRGVLTLQGPQSIGKTSWIRNLVNDPFLQEHFILEGHHLDAANKDSVFLAVSHWIVELGELDSSFKKDIARIKGFITSKYDKLRKPYAGAPSEFQRRTVFAASVNEDNFLVDPTGNSRWWTIPVVKINFDHDIDMQQVFAQLAIDFVNGEQWWLTGEEEAQLERQNRSHAAVSVIEERLVAEFENNVDSADRQKMTATEALLAIGIDKPTNPQARECGSILRRLIGSPRKIKGRTVWDVPITKDPAQRF